MKSAPTSQETKDAELRVKQIDRLNELYGYDYSQMEWTIVSRLKHLNKLQDDFESKYC